MNDTDMRERLLAQGAEPLSGTPDDLRRQLAREIQVCSNIREAAVTVD